MFGCAAFDRHHLKLNSLADKEALALGDVKLQRRDRFDGGWNLPIPKLYGLRMRGIETE
jgi:hypothetical protein